MRKQGIRSRYTRRLAAALCVTSLATAAFASGAEAGTNEPACRSRSLEVSEGTVAASLCRQNRAEKEILLITAHGATYNHLYWDWPQKPRVYSFVRNVASRRVSVLNLDLLGAGDSSHPSSDRLPMEAQTSMLHQLVTRMRAHGFEKVILVGHSSGSGTITLEASTYDDVDGLVVTGLLHPGQDLDWLGVPLSFYPATLDPAFADSGLDLGYQTTQPGTRGKAFYNTQVADPSVIAYDEAHKDVVTLSHAFGFQRVFGDPSISQAVSVPVLDLVGSHDPFCGSPACPNAARESSAWTPAARLELHVIQDAGHDIHLHGNPYAKEAFGYVRKWLRRRFS